MCDTHFLSSNSAYECMYMYLSLNTKIAVAEVTVGVECWIIVYSSCCANMINDLALATLGMWPGVMSQQVVVC